MNISAYDYNGNILKLNRKDAQGNHMDSLQYTYGNSNQLQKVKDHSGNEEGFKDGNPTGTDYVYDENGNMITDANKEIASISYNALNLPDTVVYEDGKQLVFLYDATGRKLQQQTIKGDTVKTTDYFGALYLENDTLQFINTAEGRVVPRESGWEYQYHLKDHLGNVRTTFTSNPKTETYATSFETATVPEGYFDNYEEQHRDNYTASTGTYSSRLSYDDNLLIGLAKSLKVYPGDTVRATAHAKMLDNSTEDISDLFATLASGFSSAFTNTTLGIEGQTTTISDLVYPASGTGGLLDKDDTDGTPKLYLNLLYFDKDMNFKDFSFHRTSTACLSSFEELSLEYIVPQEGYMLIYVSNEEEQANIAYFDDVNIEHNHSPVIQEESYYPFGLSQSVGFQRELSKKQRFKYNGMELEEETQWYFPEEFRTYDPALGRFMQIDPVIKMHESPYAWNTNNPILYPDPLGSDSTQRADAVAKTQEFVKKNSGNTYGFTKDPVPGGKVDCSGLAGTCMEAAGEGDARYAEGPKGNGVKRIADSTTEIEESEVEVGSFVILDNSSTGKDNPYGHMGIISNVEFDEDGNITNLDMIDSGGQPSSGKSGPRNTTLISGGKNKYYGKRITGFRKWDTIKEIYNEGTMKPVIVKGKSYNRTTTLSNKIPIPKIR